MRGKFGLVVRAGADNAVWHPDAWNDKIGVTYPLLLGEAKVGTAVLGRVTYRDEGREAHLEYDFEGPLVALGGHDLGSFSTHD